MSVSILPNGHFHTTATGIEPEQVDSLVLHLYALIERLLDFQRERAAAEATAPAADVVKLRRI